MEEWNDRSEKLKMLNVSNTMFLWIMPKSRAFTLSLNWQIWNASRKCYYPETWHMSGMCLCNDIITDCMFWNEFECSWLSVVKGGRDGRTLWLHTILCDNYDVRMWHMNKSNVLQFIVSLLYGSRHRKLCDCAPFRPLCSSHVATDANLISISVLNSVHKVRRKP